MALELQQTKAHDGRVEKMISFRIGEVKNLPPTHDLRSGRDVYVVAALDQEEIFRTATVERTLNPFYGEDFSFEVPRDFQFLSFYIYDSDCFGLLRDSRLGKVRFKYSELTGSGPDGWFPLQVIDHDSEVQGKIHLQFSIDDDNLQCITVCVVECCCLTACLTSGHSDPYCHLLLVHPDGTRSEGKRTSVKKKTTDPHFHDHFVLNAPFGVPLLECIIRISVWHQTLLADDAFLGQVNVSPKEMVKGEVYDVWMALGPRQELLSSAHNDIGSVRLCIQFKHNFIYSSEVYEPLKAFLYSSLKMKDLTTSPLFVIGQICHNRNSLANVLVSIFLKDGEVEKLIDVLANHEANVTNDANTLFRGNSLTTKVVDEFMKKVAMSYLRRTLQSIIDEIFESRKNCEVDPSKLSDNDNLESNLATLLFYVDRIFSAITSSSLSCPRSMCRVFSIIKQAAITHFPAQSEMVQYTSVSAFIFLRLFAPAILNPKLFGLRPEYANPTVSRTLTLVSKTLQNLANISHSKSGSLKKEQFMLKVYDRVADSRYNKMIKTYLGKVSEHTGGEETEQADIVHREGYMVKRGQARKKFGLKNFKTRYFVLTSEQLTYAKDKGERPLCYIPTHEIQAVERVDDEAFGMKFMMQIVQEGGRILYLKAKNTVELMEWLAILLRVTRCIDQPKIRAYHSGAYLAGNWTCCGDLAEVTLGCKPISLACQMLGRRNEIDRERELNTLYTMIASEKGKLQKIKAEAEAQARDNNELTEQLHILCELSVFLSNMELMVCNSEEKSRPTLGSKELPVECSPSDAFVIKLLS